MSDFPPTDPAALRDEDHAFVRFCRDGDTDALAEVFDATAPRLAVLAGHLVPGDAGAVEDLVQSTFLAALRTSAGFVPGRRVMPWLVTILTRQASNLRRARGRRRLRIRDVDPESFVALVEAAPDPAALVADREAAARVAEAIDRLQPPYREVLSLRLVHDLSPAEIARSLGRPVGTVHAQLHRGAERLRALLPVGLAVLVAGLLPAAAPLVVVRAVVLEAGRSTALAGGVGGGTVGGVTTALWGAVLMKKLLVGVAVLVVGLAAAWMVWEPQSAPQTDGPRAASTLVREARSGAVASPPQSADARLEVADDSGRRAELDTSAPRYELVEPVTFRGRVVAWETGQPLAGVTVTGRLNPLHPHLQPIPREQEDAGLVATESVTGADGRFALQLTPFAEHSLELLAAAPGRATMVGFWLDPLRPGAVLDSGDVELGLGAELTVRVVDQGRAPLASVNVQLQDPPDGPRSADGMWSTLGWSGLHRTGLDGRTEPRSVLAGRYAIEWVEGTGHDYVGPEHLVVPADRAQVEVELPMREPAAEHLIQGHVVDAAGTPLVGVEVVFKADAESWGYRVVATGRGGRFVAGFKADADGSVRLMRIGAGLEEIGSEYRLAPGVERALMIGDGTEHRVVVERIEHQPFVVRVVAAATGEPLVGARLGMVPTLHDEQGAHFRGVSNAGPLLTPGRRTDAEGLATLEWLPGFAQLVTVCADDAGLASVVFADVWADALATVNGPHVVEVPPAVAHRVRVVDRAGVAVAGSRVEWIRPVGMRDSAESVHGYASPLLELLDGWVGATYPNAVTVSGETDEAGLVTLHESTEVGACVLRITGAMHLEHEVALAELPVVDGLRTVVVDRAASVHGRIEPLSTLADLLPGAGLRAQAAVLLDPERMLREHRPELWLHRTDDEGDDHEDRAPLGDDGRFRFGAVPPGRYRLALESWDVDGIEPAWDIEVSGAEDDHELHLDLAPFAPARVSGTVTVNGAEPDPGVRLELGRDTVGALGEGGRFDVRVFPGTYRLALRHPFRDGIEIRLRRLLPVEIAPGEVRVLDLDFVRRAVELRVVRADGSPAAGAFVAIREVQADGSPGNGRGRRRLDDQGRATFEDSFERPLVAELLLGPLPTRGSDPEPERVLLGRLEADPSLAHPVVEFTASR